MITTADIEKEFPVCENKISASFGEKQNIIYENRLKRQGAKWAIDQLQNKP